MIAIFSSIDDYSTYEVSKWLKYFNKKYMRFNNVQDGSAPYYSDIRLQFFY
jgi:hypothetical protein